MPSRLVRIRVLHRQRPDAQRPLTGGGGLVLAAPDRPSSTPSGSEGDARQVASPGARLAVTPNRTDARRARLIRCLLRCSLALAGVRRVAHGGRSNLTPA